MSNLTWAEYAALAKSKTSGDGAEKVYGSYQHVWRSVVQAIAASQTGGDQLSGDYAWMTDQYTMTLDLEKSGAILPGAPRTARRSPTTASSPPARPRCCRWAPGTPRA